ncbi:hypothetical protein ACWD26_39175 [Streptomyces sp. NPDC002787]
MFGFSVPSGSAAFDYGDACFSPALGSTTIDGSAAVKLGTGTSRTVSARLKAATTPPEGRDLLGEVRLVNKRGTVVSVGTERIEKTTE